MSDDHNETLELRPILPRNMTARADYLVPGNPMIARPESGVNNAHPGLEFDVRALDRHFLPGLVFDFQYGLGAKLVSVDANRLKHAPATPEEIGQGLFLWAVRGRFGNKPDMDQTVKLFGQDGYMVLRRIMDLEPGLLTVVVGPPATTDELRTALDAVVQDLTAGSNPAARRPDAGPLVFACVQGNRADYLTPDGVIDPDLMGPGEITRNLCSPWQWDFADCFCYYWASSKPDIVVGISGNAQVLNFQRDRQAREPARPTPDPKKWMEGNLTGVQMIKGWEELPVVIADREAVAPRVPHWPLIDKTMCLDEIATELANLAELEHALCIEYLFARMSLKAPQRAPMRIFGKQLKRFQAAREVLDIAVDEMRHFRWVNEALWLLGKPPSLKRAEVIGRDLQRAFSLRPLTPGTLEEFIGIEAPGSVYNDDPQQLDSVYTKILVSLHHLDIEITPKGDPKEIDRVRRLKHLMKIIIDEGESHWERFRLIKRHLAGQAPSTYLHFLKRPKKATAGVALVLQRLCNAYYDVLLHALYITFRIGRNSRGHWLEISHFAMYGLDDAAYHLIELGFAPRFTRPEWSKVSSIPPPFAATAPGNDAVPPDVPAEVIGSKDNIEDMFVRVLALLDELIASAQGRVRQTAERQKKRMLEMKAAALREFDAPAPAG
jgi:hypothetical protein